MGTLPNTDHTIYTNLQEFLQLHVVDAAADPTANGDINLNGTAIKLYSDSVARNATRIPVTARKTATVTITNDDSLNSDADLKLTVAANSIWSFTAWLRVNSVAAADIKFGWSVPAGTTMSWGDANGTNDLGEGDTLFFATSALGEHVLIKGVIVVGSTAGTATLQWAQFTADAGNTSVLINSYIEAIQIG